MKIKEIEERIEQKIIESISVLTDIINDIDDKKLTPEEKVKSIKHTIDYLLRDFNNTFRMSKNNRNLLYNGEPALICKVEELKTAILEYIIKNNEDRLSWDNDNDLFKDFE